MTKLEELKLLAFELDNLDKVVSTHEVSKTLQKYLLDAECWNKSIGTELNNKIRELKYKTVVEQGDSNEIAVIGDYITHKVYTINRTLERNYSIYREELMEFENKGEEERTIIKNALNKDSSNLRSDIRIKLYTLSENHLKELKEFLKQYNPSTKQYLNEDEELLEKLELI